ncbi:MAG: hypothetical protein PT942_01680 [Eubacteriales bacterium]|nr:hypothetical protein [Eubacteriales bacterium]
MRNTLGDLNNHLFAELERLGDEELTGEELDKEIRRAAAISSVSKNIIANANVILQATKFKAVEMMKSDEMPKMLEG